MSDLQQMREHSIAFIFERGLKTIRRSLDKGTYTHLSQGHGDGMLLAQTAFPEPNSVNGCPTSIQKVPN